MYIIYIFCFKYQIFKLSFHLFSFTNYNGENKYFNIIRCFKPKIIKLSVNDQKPEVKKLLISKITSYYFDIFINFQPNVKKKFF